MDWIGLDLLAGIVSPHAINIWICGGWESESSKQNGDWESESAGFKVLSEPGLIKSSTCINLYHSINMQYVFE